MSETENQPRDGRWLVLAGLAVVGAPTAAVIAQRTDGWKFWLLIGAQLLLTAIAFTIPQLLSRRAKRGAASAQERELNVRADTRAALGDALEPVLVQLGEISVERSKPARDQLIAQAI